MQQQTYLSFLFFVLKPLSLSDESELCSANDSSSSDASSIFVTVDAEAISWFTLSGAEGLCKGVYASSLSQILSEKMKLIEDNKIKCA